jgi:glutaryl-CoA dehydrogenase
MASLNPHDIYALDELFTDEERLIHDTVLEWVKERYLPLIEDHYEAGTFPLEVVGELAPMGVFGATLPEQYGCANVSAAAYGLINQALEYGDSGLRSLVSVQSGLVMHPIHAFGTDAQRERWLPPLARGEVIGCFGLTEPDHGSDPGGMVTRAMPAAGGFVLNGAKAWITNGSIADVAVVWAKVGPPSGDGAVDAKTIRGFLVERGMPGFSASEYKRKLSLRASVTSELFLKDVFVPEENMLSGVEGLRGPLSCLNQARYGIAWGAMGAAMFCFEAALRYSLERQQFGAPIASFQLQQQKLSEMATAIVRGRLVCWRLGQLKQAGRAAPAQISLAKRDNVYQARRVARMAREMFGAMGIMLESHVMRHSANLESVYTYEGTHDVHHLILGEALTGISAYGG